jgi:hypothetical protein
MCKTIRQEQSAVTVKPNTIWIEQYKKIKSKIALIREEVNNLLWQQLEKNGTLAWVGTTKLYFCIRFNTLTAFRNLQSGF